MLNGFDLLTAAKDRDLVADKARHRQLWPVLGRPGTVARDGEIVGTWRPRSSGRKLTIAVELFRRPASGLVNAVEAQAGLVARARGQELFAVELAEP